MASVMYCSANTFSNSFENNVAVFHRRQLGVGPRVGYRVWLRSELRDVFRIRFTVVCLELCLELCLYFDLQLGLAGFKVGIRV
jgi:hypothetical protein